MLSLSRASLFGLSLGLAQVGCGPVQEDLGDPPPNMSTSAGGQASTASGAGSESETSAGTSGAADMMSGCDPLADPVEECGEQMRCELESLTCVEANGIVGIDGPCASTEDCVPGLACTLGYCADLCEVEAEEPCAVERVCVDAGGASPGLCLESCLLSTQACSAPGQACNRANAAGGELVAVCTGNVGTALESEACTFDDDCAGGFLCTPAAAHGVECQDAEPACCAAICELGVIGCFGAEMGCVELGILGQEQAGYCGLA